MNRHHESLLVFLSFSIALGGCQRVDKTPPPDVVTTASGVQMVQIPGGTFMMGSRNGEADEQPVHEVILTSFLIDQYEVTHEMFTAAELPNPSK